MSIDKLTSRVVSLKIEGVPEKPYQEMASNKEESPSNYDITSIMQEKRELRPHLDDPPQVVMISSTLPNAFLQK